VKHKVQSGEEYLNAREAARYLGISPTTLYRLINTGTLRPSAASWTGGSGWSGAPTWIG
jgi:predicted DNA-binding transcriptional regulator AlpA